MNRVVQIDLVHDIMPHDNGFFKHNIMYLSSICIFELKMEQVLVFILHSLSFRPGLHTSLFTKSNTIAPSPTSIFLYNVLYKFPTNNRLSKCEIKNLDDISTYENDV
jgi:hypothetical protein